MNLRPVSVNTHWLAQVKTKSNIRKHNSTHNTMNEDKFWGVIKEMNYTEKGYKGAAQYLIDESGLNTDQMHELENMVHKKVCELYRRLRDVNGCGDDGFSDLCYQIVSNGKDAFEAASVESAQQMVDNYEYTESFAYTFNHI